MTAELIIHGVKGSPFVRKVQVSDRACSGP